MTEVVYSDAHTRLYRGDARAVLAGLPAGTVDCAVTSPPYWRKRDYGTLGQYGLEERFDDYVRTLRAVFTELRRVLAPEGTFWLNLGDSYITTGTGPRTNSGTLDGAPNARTTARGFGAKSGLPAKNLVGIPWRVALALQDDGWLLRSAVIWHKTNAMPESVRDRPASRYEHIFLFTKQNRYFFDLDPIREPHRGSRQRGRGRHRAYESGGGIGSPHTLDRAQGQHPHGRNPGDVWSLGTWPSGHGHHASYPLAIPRRCVAAGCRPGGTVLDPFSGSGTTLLAARQLGRAAIGVDLNPDYHAIAIDRLTREATP